MSDVRIPLPQLRAYIERCKQDPQTKVALVLSASAAPGAYHAGVIDALLQAKVPIDVVIGTSGGAISACLCLLAMLSDPPQPGLAAEVWSRLTMDQVLSPTWVLRAWQRLQSFSMTPWAQAGAAIVFFPMLLLGLPQMIRNIRTGRALFSSDPLRRSIISTLYAGLKQEKSGWRNEVWIGAALSRRWQLAGGPEMIITATDMDTMDDVLFTMASQETVERLQAKGRKVIPLATRPTTNLDRPGLLVPALMASAALFPFFPLQQIGNLLLGDGGFLGATPLDLAIEAGATHVLVVEVDTPANAGPVDRSNIGGLIKRIAATMVTARNRSIQRSNLEDIRCFYLSPSAKFLTFLDFDGRFARGRVVMPLSGQIVNGRRDAVAGFWLDPGSFSDQGLCYTDPWGINGT